MAVHTSICKLQHVIRTCFSSTAGTRLSTKTSCLQDEECVTSCGSQLCVMQHMLNTIWHCPIDTLQLTILLLLGLWHLSIANRVKHHAEFCSSNVDTDSNCTASPMRRKVMRSSKNSVWRLGAEDSGMTQEGSDVSKGKGGQMVQMMRCCFQCV